MGKLNIAFGLYFAITSFLTGKIYNADAKKLFEGDLILSEAQIEAASHGGIADSPAHMRKASKQYLWPGGVVPYSMETQLEEDALALEAITNGMRLWSSKTCITFKERKDQKAFIYFFIGGSCSSEVGRSGDKQYITLASHCWNAGDVAHVVAHSLGFYHEQSRPDRDDFVTINWDNIVESIGQRKGPSVLDIKQMNLLYKCNGYGGDGGGGGGTGGGGDGGGGGGTGGGGGSGGGAGGENCKDLNKRCDYWARIGECNRNSGYMRIFCKKSCQLCYAQGNCSDRNQYCSYWAAQGYCHYNPAYMKSHCKRSCRVCG